MMEFTQEQLDSILKLHRKWLYYEDGGKYADLRGADLRGADLYGADLRGADLRGADLCGADLRGADLRGAKNIDQLTAAQTVILPEGILFGYKKAHSSTGKSVIVKLLIPADAKRSNATGRKCRAEFADVVSITNLDGETRFKSAISDRGGEYITGKRIYPDEWDDDRWNECSNGIHFFITREEAVRY